MRLGEYLEVISILIDLDRRGIPIKANTTYTVYGNQLTAHLTLDIENAQIATFIPDWNKTNEALAAGEITPEEYEFWLNNTLQIFNVRIDDYIYNSFLQQKNPENLGFPGILRLDSPVSFDT